MPTTLRQNPNLETSRPSPGVSFEQQQRHRMLIALAVLLIALIVVLVKDRQFWFPPSPESAAAVEPSTPPLATPTAPSTAKPADLSRPAPFSKAKKVRVKSAAADSAHSSAPAPAAVSPAITTSRAVLPPLEVEVVAGNQRRTLAPSNPSVKVDMQSDTPADTGPAAASRPDQANGGTSVEAAAQVSLSPGTVARVSRTVEPSYPLLAKQMKVQGAVVLQALIDKAGSIQDLRVISGPAILSAAAQEAVRQWHFKPFYRAGQPVETEARITVNFTISTY